MDDLPSFPSYLEESITGGCACAPVGIKRSKWRPFSQRRHIVMGMFTKRVDRYKTKDTRLHYNTPTVLPYLESYAGKSEK